MNDEDIKNLVGWLQAIYKESNLARTTAEELKRSMNLVQNNQGAKQQGSNSQETKQMVDKTRNYLEERINRLEDMISDLRQDVNSIKSKIENSNLNKS